MKFKTVKPLVLVGVKGGTSKKGKAFRVATVASPDTFERVEIFVEESCVISEAMVGKVVLAELEVSQRGYYLAVGLVSVVAG